MKRWISRLGWFFLGVAFTLVLVAGAAWMLHRIYAVERPPGPPFGARVGQPWGSVDVSQLGRDKDVQNSIASSFKQEGTHDFDADHDGVHEYPLLAISGGGANGAFGAGFLCGWTKTGTRPKFKVVTGVSVGSLQAPFAFLGPEYDHVLREIFTELHSNEIYIHRPAIAAIWQDSIFDTAPLRKLVEKYLTDEVFQKIAEEHRKGRRLFIGSTNIDSREFTIWDLGEIAASGPPRRPAAFHQGLDGLLCDSGALPAGLLRDPGRGRGLPRDAR